MVMGNKAWKEIEDAKIAIVKNPRNFIAQPIIQLSTAPCFIDGEQNWDMLIYVPNVDLWRQIVPGGLTRVHY
jgi:uncharacterized circularly permuted ATP-grasp superfamily protein